jgi:leucine efflux protein
LFLAKGGEVFAEFGVLNFWTYVVGAFFIVLVPGPNTLFVLKTGLVTASKKVIWLRRRVYR